ncbi:MAG: hypothetical protein JNK41_10560 [Saprospiraceae bacterium]|nr:hypothetical protein [Saprospiraceae bacterium]
MSKKLFKFGVIVICAIWLISQHLLAQSSKFIEGLDIKQILYTPQGKTKPILNGIHPLNRTID